MIKRLIVLAFSSLWMVSCGSSLWAVFFGDDDNGGEKPIKPSMSYANVLIDLSQFNNPVDLVEAKEDGILAVFHRATIGCPRLVEEGKQDLSKSPVQNIRYKERVASAKALGLLWGAYHYGLGGWGVSKPNIS